MYLHVVLCSSRRREKKREDTLPFTWSALRYPENPAEGDARFLSVVTTGTSRYGYIPANCLLGMDSRQRRDRRIRGCAVECCPPPSGLFARVKAHSISLQRANKSGLLSPLGDASTIRVRAGHKSKSRDARYCRAHNLLQCALQPTPTESWWTLSLLLRLRAEDVRYYVMICAWTRVSAFARSRTRARARS